jgi:MEMO1 family protein
VKRFILLPLLLFVLVSSGCRAGSNSGPVREPAMAGQFYSGDADELRLAVTEFLGDAVHAHTAKPIAIVVPHAGYVYSGQIAADAFEQTAGQKYDVIVILGTNHTTPGFRGASVFAKGTFRTPLGDAVIDDAVAAKILSADKDFVFDPKVHEREHSIEVELPFVRYLFPEARIVPIVVGSPDLDLCTRLGNAVAAAIEGKNALIVASSDLSHYPSHDDADLVDRTTLKAVAGLNPEVISSTIIAQMDHPVRELATCACGEGPILTAAVAAKRLGATRGVIVSYANSGDGLSSTSNRVVGYGAVVMDSGPGGTDTTALNVLPEAAPGTPLSDSDKTALLDLARRAIEWHCTADVEPLPRGLSPAAVQKAGAFVTLKENGELRGCIGRMMVDMPLAQVVGGVAVSAAFHDTRFRPVEHQELDKITLEISMLTPSEFISGPDQIVLGRDGVVIEKDGRSAVYLPQVATEQGWSRDEMLDNLCLKAGLPKGAWRANAQLSTFQAVVFSEPKH